MGLLSWARTDPVANLRAVVGDQELPSFPAVTLKALGLIRDENSTAGEIADVVVADPGVSVHLLQTVNSAAYALRRSVESVHQAVSLLGRNELESLLISTAVGRVLPKAPAMGFDPKRFWVTSTRRAVAARTLADRVNPAIRSQCFTAALLQDMAIPLLAHRRADSYGEVLSRWHRGAEDLPSIERALLGWDHALVASWMAEHWKMPKALVAAIRAHHETDDAASALAPVSLVAHLREVNDELGIERLVIKAESDLLIPRDEATRLVQESFQAADRDMTMLG